MLVLDILDLKPDGDEEGVALFPPFAGCCTRRES